VPLEPPPPGDDRLPDAGPRYTETPADPYAPDARVPAEPWNTVTAALFIVLALYRLAKMRGQFGRRPFLAAALPILLLGGVGGTLYHAFRTRAAYFYLDLIPILLLGAATAAFFAWKLCGWYGRGTVALAATGLLAGFVTVNALVFRVATFENRNIPVNVSYGAQAVLILAPLAVVLVRTRFRDGAFVAAALVSFAIAWFCRLVDRTPLDGLPMGTHWLWHLFGAICTACLIEYVWRIDRPVTSPVPAAGPFPAGP
jgi:hypothetical protein